MIEDLRRAYRTAIRGNTPENATTIANQIARIEAQIAALQPEAKPEAPADGGRAGLDPRLVGVLVTGVPSVDSRVNQISPTGGLKVLHDDKERLGGSDVGAEYQGVVRDGYFIVHFSHWTHKEGQFRQGRVQMLRVADDGQLDLRHGIYPEFERTGKVNLVFNWNYPDFHFESPEALKQARAGRPNPPDEDDDNPHAIDEDFVDDEDDVSVEEDDPDGTTFFGVPVK